MKQIIGHNFSFKFPLAPNCLLPFTNNFNNKWILPRGVNNVRFDFYFDKGYVRQTNKSLIVFPFLETIDAKPRKAFELRNILAEKAVAIVKQLMQEFSGLSVSSPVEWKPSTQEYAIEDEYAKKLPFTVRNEVGQIDKSRHVDESGHVFSGGEIDFFSPEFADAYIRMPVTFLKAMKMFEENMESHVKAIKKIGESAEKLGQTTLRLEKHLRPKRNRLFRGSFRKSATKRAIN